MSAYLGFRVYPLNGSDLVIEVRIVVIKEEGRNFVLVGLAMEIRKLFSQRVL
jgi:hypothetical protein